MRSVVHHLGGIIIGLNLIAVPTVASGQVLHHFATGEGGPPAGELTAGRDGKLYGANCELLRSFDNVYDAAGDLETAHVRHADGTETHVP